MLPILSSLLVMFALSIVWTVWLTRLRHGKYVCLEKSDRRFKFQTDCGTFTLDRQYQRIVCVPPQGKQRAFDLKEIRGIKFKSEFQEAFWQEFFLSDSDFTDWFFKRFRDQDQSCTISLLIIPSMRVSPQGTSSQGHEFWQPIFIAEQYQIRDIFPIIPALIELSGIRVDCEQKSRKVLAELRHRFAAVGAEVPLL